MNDSGFTILQQVYLRLAVSTVAALFVFNRYIDYSRLRRLPAQEWLLLIIRGVGSYLIGVVLFSEALIHTKVGTASLISTLPLVPVLGFVFFKEKVTAGKLACTLSACLGAFLIAATQLATPFDWGKGELLALISVIGYTIAYVGRKWHSNALNNREMTAFMLLFGLLGVATASVIRQEGLPVQADWSIGVAGIIVFAGLINVLNLLLINYVFQVLSNVLAGNLLMLEALFGILCGYLVYDEVLSVRQLAGGALLVASVIWLNSIESRFAAVPAGTT